MNWSGIIGALLIFVMTLGMLLFVAFRELWRKRHCGVLGAAFSIFFSVAMLRVMATKPNPDGPSTAPRRDASSMGAPTDDSTNEVSCAAWETTLAFSKIDKTPTNLTLRVSCPSDFFDHDVILDCSVSDCLTNSFSWVTNLTLAAGCTNIDFVLTPMLVCGATNFPIRMFARVSERASTASTMLDSDEDGLPDVYELHNGTNPYVQDYELAPKVVVGSDAESLSVALGESEPYSIIEIPSGEAQISGSLVFPDHPVLVSGPQEGYAVLRSSSGLGAFMFRQGQDEQTLVRNLYLVLEKRGDFQVGFWCGGNLPWSGIGSNPTFENVVVRMPRPETQYIGWLFYRDNGGVASLSNCLVDAGGATDVRGVETGNGPEVLLQDFSCRNFPTSGIPKLARTFSLGDGGVTNQIRQVGLEATVFVDLTSGVDSDGDGYTNEEEVNTLHTNPWLADSDGDGLPDPLELLYGSDPMDVRSFPRKIYVSLTNTTDVAGSSVYVSWGRSGVGIEATPLTNTVERSTSCEFDVPPSQGNVYVTAFRDLNGNGVFDADYDIVRSETISDLTEVSHLRFAFGDVDADGVADDQERVDGTDPYSALSLKISLRVSLANNDPSDAIDTYYFYGLSPFDCVSGPYAFIGRSTTFNLERIVTNRVAYLTVFRDVDCNGVFDEGVDLCSAFTVANGVQTREFSIGDVDGDKVPDTAELAEGTDPTNRLDYCYHPLPTVQDIFSTTNILWCQAYFGTNIIAAAMAVTNEVMAFDFGHLHATNSEILIIKFWDDVNQNGVLDDDEASSSVLVSPNGHDFTGTYTLAYGEFDSNHNNLPDWWEDDRGLLSTTLPHGTTDDTDGDGLINLHEYWADCDPLVPDGSNTLLSVFSRSVDDRIANVDPVASVGRFVDYEADVGTGLLRISTNFWVKGVDVSCVSVAGGGGTMADRPATAITRRHVVMSWHWNRGEYVFCDASGATNKYTIVDSYNFPDSDLYVGRLDRDLPTTIQIPYLLPEDYEDYLYIGKYLPIVSMNQNRSASVLEIEQINGVERVNGVAYYQMTRTRSEPPINMSRSDIRHATIDGNSGTPKFFLLGDRLVFLFSTHGGVSGSTEWGFWVGPNISHRLNAVQRAIDNWEGENASCYQLNVLDLSTYKKVSHGR